MRLCTAFSSYSPVPMTTPPRANSTPSLCSRPSTGAPAGQLRKKKPGSDVDRVGAAYRGIVELLDEFVTSVLREGLNGLALPLVAVLVGADVGGRTRSQVGERRSRDLGWSSHKVRLEASLQHTQPISDQLPMDV